MLNSSSVIRSEVAQMMAHLTALQGSWGGQASGAFQSLMAEWRATAQQVEESLGHITQGLTAVGQSYEEVELSNLRMFAR